MMNGFSDNAAFKELLDRKKIDILQRTSDGIQESFQFQRLLSIFAECRRKHEEQDYRLIIMRKMDVLNLCDNANVKADELYKSVTFLLNRTVHVDANLSVLNSNNDSFPADNNEARRYYMSLSTQNDWIVFLIAPDAIVNYFIDGIDYGDGVFYSGESRKSYEHLKTINQIDEVFDDYRIRLTRQDTYLKFFVPKEELHMLYELVHPAEDENDFVKNYKHLLHNKPEELFREDLRNYIQDHMRVVVTRELLLEDLDRLDIELTDEIGNDLYFIEIKWVGESIGSNSHRNGIKYNALPRVRPDAVRQVVGYIDELLKEDKNIKIGYLAVFDARKEDLSDTGEGIIETDLPVELRKHYPRFMKIKDFRVKNENPR